MSDSVSLRSFCLRFCASSAPQLVSTTFCVGEASVLWPADAWNATIISFSLFLVRARIDWLTNHSPDDFVENCDEQKYASTLADSLEKKAQVFESIFGFTADQAGTTPRFIGIFQPLPGDNRSGKSDRPIPQKVRLNRRALPREGITIVIGSLEAPALKQLRTLEEQLVEAWASRSRSLLPETSHLEPGSSPARYSAPKPLRSTVSQLPSASHEPNEARRASCDHPRAPREELERPTGPLAEQTYLAYRNVVASKWGSPELVEYLEGRYGCEAFRLAGSPFPVTVFWQNTDRNIHPDRILGPLDPTPPKRFLSSPTIGPSDYEAARMYIKTEYEKDEVKYEGCDYCMTHINVSEKLPQLCGSFGWYYDNILTQFAMEWELKKALLSGGDNALRLIAKAGSLPLREAIERGRNPLVDGTGRCAALSIATLLIFKRRGLGYYCLVRDRSIKVGVAPGLFHVMPAGMFEAPNSQDPWSIEMSVWRELLEEVYSDAEQETAGNSRIEDDIRKTLPISLLLDMLKNGSAELSVTGVYCDLLCLRPEVSTVLFVKDPEFCECRRMKINWEYVAEGPDGKFAVPWENIDAEIQKESTRGRLAVGGAVCLGLGRAWVRQRYGI